MRNSRAMNFEESTTDELLEEIREWLRYHNDWGVHLEFWSLYGTYAIQVHYLGKFVSANHGTTFSKRLAWVKEKLYTACPLTVTHPRCTASVMLHDRITEFGIE